MTTDTRSVGDPWVVVDLLTLCRGECHLEQVQNSIKSPRLIRRALG